MQPEAHDQAATHDTVAPPPGLSSPELWRKLVPVVAGALVIYAGLFALADVRPTLREIEKVGCQPLVLASLLSVVSFLIRGIRWHYLVRQLGAHVPLVDNLLVSASGLAMTITPGKAGEILKPLMLKQRFSIPVSTTIPLLLLERLFDLLAIVFLTGLALSQVEGRQHLAFAALGISIAGAIGAASLPHLIVHFPARWLESKLVASRRDKANRAVSSLRACLAMRPLMIALSLSILAWGVQSLTVWIFSRAFGSDGVSLASGVVAYCAPLVAGALTMLPGGLGATEASMAGILVFLTRPPLDVSVAAALTILVRLATFWLGIAVGIAALVAWRWRRRLTDRGRHQPAVEPLTPPGQTDS